MPKQAALVPNEHLHIRIEPSLKQRVDLLLFSSTEGRIPKGAHKEFVEARLREWFDYTKISLTAYGFPEGFFVSGPPEMIDALRKRLENV